MKNIKKFGLVGKKIEYSFSRNFFSKKFSSDSKFSNYYYNNYDIESINDINKIFNTDDLYGLNVTIPYKEKVISYLDRVSEEAREIGAVNTICFENGNKVGYNTDLYGFTESLKLNKIENIESILILGTGGAAKTVTHYSIKNNIHYNLVSRQKSNLHLSYSDLNEDNFKKRLLIVNCTPVGTYPDVDKCPDLPYELINKKSIFFDLVYNPPETLFIKKGKEIGCKTLNGHEMLRLQAEKSLKIWLDWIE